MKRILIYGAGAMGGFLAACLTRAGHSVSLIARGEHAAVIGREGLRVVGSGGREERIETRVLRSPSDAGQIDWLFVTLKAHQVHPLVDQLAPVAEEAELLIPVHNGVGWWYFQRGGPAHLRGRPVAALDPDGALAERMPVERAAPMFAFKSAEVVAPGVIRHIVSATDRMVLGELGGARLPAVDELIAALAGAGIACERADPRHTMWVKLLGNIFANPICALTGHDLGTIIRHPAGHELALGLMGECAAVAAALGVEVETRFEDRLARSLAVGAARPSMLQDRDAGRPMEIDAILTALIELGQLCGIATPRTQALQCCLRLVESGVTPLAPPLADAVRSEPTRQPAPLSTGDLHP
jgi:2-dehydropantoate 2-reductase